MLARGSILRARFQLAEGRLKTVAAYQGRFAELNPRARFVAKIDVKPFREQEEA